MQSHRQSQMPITTHRGTEAPRSSSTAPILILGASVPRWVVFIGNESMKRALLLLVGIVPLVLAIDGAVPLHAQDAAAQADFFEAKVQPVFTANCIGCHGDAAMGGLRMTSREGLLKGG